VLYDHNALDAGRELRGIAGAARRAVEREAQRAAPRDERASGKRTRAEGATYGGREAVVWAPEASTSTQRS
jgi:hypothetical protein